MLIGGVPNLIAVVRFSIFDTLQKNQFLTPEKV
jgi:hypothetical protein